ncbi:MAG: replicative DNA helicase [Spirochaetes bacterium]|nr:replicative DNA helicase [Spirochaetota bacterium]MBU0956133.1 replicative DNA helicase [Spirochaetota bacterium]
MIPGELKDKVPPHNSEAEQASLGALLLDPDAVPHILRYLRPDDYYINANRNVFSAIISLFEKGQKADLITLADEMRSLGTLDNSGGVAYIAHLTDIVPSSANVEYYAKIVSDCSIRRALIKMSAGIKQAAHNDSIETSLMLDEIQENIFKITQNKQTVNYKSVKEIIPETMLQIEKFAKNKSPYTGLPTGYTDLDNMTSGLQDSELIIIGARPSVGKTAFGLNMAANMALRENVSVGFFSAEMSDMSLMYRMLASEARVSSEKIKSGLIKSSDIQKLMEAASRIYEAPLYLVDVPNIKLLDLRSLARRMKSEQNIQILFIDYLGLISHENADMPRWEQISSISRSLKALARELRIPIVALAQLKREAEGKQPSLADLRDSGSIEQDADVILFLHRDREIDKRQDERLPYISTDIYISKQRNGPVGKFSLLFFQNITRFENLEKEHAGH